MATPATVNLTIVRGDDETIIVVFTTSSGLLDLTGRTYRAHLRANRSLTGTPAADFTCTVPTPANGEVHMSMGSAETQTLDPNVTYWWDLEETAAGPVVTTLLMGRVTVVQDVSHA